MSQDVLKTVRVQPWGQGQGAFVEINEADFDPNKHKLFVPAAPSAPPPAVNKSPATKGTGKKKAVVESAQSIVDFASDESAELAVEAGLSAEQMIAIKGTGENGAVTVADVQAAIDALNG